MLHLHALLRWKRLGLALAAYHIALNNYAGNLEYGYGATLALVLVAIGLVLSLAYLRIFNFDALVARPRIEM